MAIIPGQTGTPARAVDGLEGPTAGSPVSFPAGFKGSQIPETVPDANLTMTISSPSTIVLNPTANRVVTLPTTGIPANYSVTVINRSASFTVAIQPSGGGTITTVGLGQVTVISTIASPTTTSHWFISSDGAILQGGNSLGVPMLIGTNDAQNLSLETSGVARVILNTSGNMAIPSTSNQITLGTTNTTTISVPAPAASRTYTIPDAGGAANFIMSAGTNTITGTLTLPATVSFPSLGSITKAGIGALTLTAAGTSTMTFPSITGTVATIAGTETLTNKTITASGLITASSGLNVTGTTTFNSAVNTNATHLGGWGLVPVGGIIAYNPGYYTSGSNAGFTVAGPAGNTVAQVNTFLNTQGWYVCDGAAVNVASTPIWNAASRFLPNLTDSRFLMGSTTSGIAAAGDTSSGSASASWTTASVNTTFTQPTVRSHYHSADGAGSTINITSSGSHLHQFNTRLNATGFGAWTIAFATQTGTDFIADTTTTGSNHTHSSANIAGLLGLVTGGQNGDANTATVSGAASFDKTVMNTNQTAHSHAIDVTPTYLSTYFIIRVF